MINPQVSPDNRWALCFFPFHFLLCLVVKVLSFYANAIGPILILCGIVFYIAYRESKAGIALYILFSKGETSDGQSSAYTYNALGARITNVQVRENQNAGNQNGDLLDGSHGVNYLDFLKDGRFDWQRVFESEVGTAHQNDFETVTKHYTVDYLSVANRDIMVTEDGSWTARYVYEENGTRISAEFGYAAGTHPGEGGKNLQSDFAANDVCKVWYRTSHLGSTLFAVDADGEVISHTVYDPWGNPLTETYTDANFSGLDNANNFTGYTWDEVLGLYFAQNRFYDAVDHRFTQEDIVKDGANWYTYCWNNPLNRVDVWGFVGENPYSFIDWDSLTPYSGNSEYYSARAIFTQLGGDVIYDSKTHKATLTYSYEDKTVTLKYNMNSVPRTKVLGFLTKAIEGSNFVGTFSGSESPSAVSLIYANKQAYVSRASIRSYFEKVWCMGQQSKPSPVVPDVIPQSTVINNWLYLNSTPTYSGAGRIVRIPEAANPSKWAMLEGQTDINRWAKKIIGDTNSVVIGPEGELLDKDSRYWVAVGPKVINPDFANDRTVTAEDMKYGTKIDVKIKDVDGNIYYIYTTVGDAKVHTYPNGIYQTGDSFPNGTDSHPQNNDGSIIEFMGKASISGLTEYDIMEIIVYD